MKTDTLDRRKRSTSQPKGEGYSLTPRIRRMFAAIRRHGPLPTHILFQFWQGQDGGYFPYFQDVMTRIFHEPKGKEPLVFRPLALNPDYGPNPEPAWYDLTETGYAIAQEESDIILPSRRDAHHHRGMGACIGASFELLAPQYGMQYLDYETILSHDRCPAGTRASLESLKVELGHKRNLEPDYLFGFRYEGDYYKFFTREDDLASESFTRSDKTQNSIQDKIDKYLDLFATKKYEDHWGLLKLHGVLFTTTKPGRLKKPLAYLEGKSFADRFYFKVLPQFDRYSWRAPRQPIEAVFEPWTTVNGPRDLRQL